MTRAEAEERAARLQVEDPDAATHRFAAREGPDGEWEVVKVRIPKDLQRQPLTPTVAAAPSPADDVRTGHERRVPGAPGGV